MPAWLIPAAIAAGQYVASKIGGKKNQQSQTGVDPTTDWYNRLGYESAGAAGGAPTEADFHAWMRQQEANGVKFGDTKARALGREQFLQQWNSQPHGSIQGVDPQTAAAIQGYGQYAGLGQQGVAALGGDQAALAKYMNPYQTNVLDQVRSQYGLLNAQAQMGINDAATRAGAFGGSRQGVASGVASGEIARGLGQQISGLEYQGFNDAMGRAGDQARLGLGALGALPGLGQYQQQINDPNLRRLMFIKQAQAGSPYGQTSTQQVNSNPAGGALGTFATLYGLFGGGGQQKDWTTGYGGYSGSNPWAPGGNWG